MSFHTGRSNISGALQAAAHEALRFFHYYLILNVFSGFS